MINAEISKELEVMTSDEFNKARVFNKWAVFSKEDIDLFVEHISNTAVSDNDLEKAKKDISKLVGKVIVDSIGRRKTVWIKPMDMIKKPTKSGEASPENDVHADALARHNHNTKVQRMGKEASLKQVERHFGKEVVDKIREQSILKPSESTEEATPKSKEDSSGLEYMTAGRNKIDVHKDAIETIKTATGKASTQQDIENAKSLFVKYMTKTEGYTDKQSVITFHRYLKNGDNEQMMSNADGGYTVVDMEDVMVQAGIKPDKADSKVKRIITDENLNDKVAEYTDEVVKKIEKDGMKVDARWRSGIASNFHLLVEHVDNRDWSALKEFLSIKNHAWRQFFTEYTGIALPDSDKDTSMFIFKHMYKK